VATEAAAGHQIELNLQQINKCMSATNCNHLFSPPCREVLLGGGGGGGEG
jgi:hypothetical protein